MFNLVYVMFSFVLRGVKINFNRLELIFTHLIATKLITTKLKL